jgi:hypothetical protein
MLAGVDQLFTLATNSSPLLTGPLAVNAQPEVQVNEKKPSLSPLSVTLDAELRRLAVEGTVTVDLQRVLVAVICVPSASMAEPSRVTEVSCTVLP